MSHTRAHITATAVILRTHTTVTHACTHCTRAGSSNAVSFLSADKWDPLWDKQGRLSFENFVFVFCSWLDLDEDDPTVDPTVDHVSATSAKGDAPSSHSASVTAAYRGADHPRAGRTESNSDQHYRQPSDAESEDNNIGLQI
jgi:hypothetical protein